MNDPFDCKIDSFHKGSPNDWKLWLERQPGSESEKEVIWNNLISNNFDASRYSRNDQAESLLVLSLTERNDNVLMWSHYAKYHTGFCLGFRTSNMGDSTGLLFEEEDIHFPMPRATKGFLSLLKINYQLLMPKPFNSLVESDTERLVEFALRKHPDWEYERERRIIILREIVRNQNVRYSRNILSEVIFGCMAESKTIDRVNKILESKFPNAGKDILKRKAVPIKGQYAVEIVDQ